MKYQTGGEKGLGNYTMTDARYVQPSEEEHTRLNTLMQQYHTKWRDKKRVQPILWHALLDWLTINFKPSEYWPSWENLDQNRRVRYTNNIEHRVLDWLQNLHSDGVIATCDHLEHLIAELP